MGGMTSGRKGTTGGKGDSPIAMPLADTAGRRWRFRRNLVIYLAHRRNGLSQRLLADVFDLPRSRIAAILKEFEHYDPDSRP